MGSDTTMCGDTGQFDELRRAVLQYARAHKGLPVGPKKEGCAALADKALGAAKAKSADDYGPVTPTSDYSWGQPVSLECARPGDILQFKDHVATVTTTKETNITFPKGESYDYQEVKPHSYARGHHTAVVEKSLSDGIFIVWEQHVKRGSSVVDNRDDVGTIHVSDSRTVEHTKEPVQITQAWGKKVKPFLSQKAVKAKIDELVRRYNGTTFTADVETTIEISVTGTIKAYRPEPR